MGKKIKIPKITKETTIEKIYSEKDINKIKTIIKKLFNIDIPITHIEKQLLIKIRKPMEFISSYDNNKKNHLQIFKLNINILMYLLRLYLLIKKNYCVR